jgi:tRNA A-37 threonylcarbamoyl transferase component Bud32
MASVFCCRHAALKDLDVCQTALARLHQLATRHGDTNKHNLLIHQGTATLINFDNALETALNSELEEEIYRLQDNLGDVFNRGGRCVEAAKGENPSLYNHLWA